MELTQHHIDILDRNKNHFNTAKDGWVSNVTDLNELIEIYQIYCDSRYSATKWCKDCVMKLMQRLGAWYEKQKVIKPKLFDGKIIITDVLKPFQELHELEKQLNENIRTRHS